MLSNKTFMFWSSVLSQRNPGPAYKLLYLFIRTSDQQVQLCFLNWLLDLNAYWVKNIDTVNSFRSTCVPPQIVPWPELLSAHITGKGDSVKMVCFNVVSYGYSLHFLSTQFANFSPFSSFAILNKVFTFFHHWFHLFIKFLQVSWYKIGNCYSSFIIPIL